jgi:hypothetical protein
MQASQNWSAAKATTTRVLLDTTIAADEYVMALGANNAIIPAAESTTHLIEHTMHGQLQDQQIEVATKKRRIKIHDSDSDDSNTVGKFYQDKDTVVPQMENVAKVDCNPIAIAKFMTSRELQTGNNKPSAILSQKLQPQMHNTSCGCTKCADCCKYMDVTAKHIGTDSSGTTGSSDSEDCDSFICSEEESFTNADEKQLQLMFPITSKRMLRPADEQHKRLSR